MHVHVKLTTHLVLKGMVQVQSYVSISLPMAWDINEKVKLQTMVLYAIEISTHNLLVSQGENSKASWHWQHQCQDLAEGLHFS